MMAALSEYVRNIAVLIVFIAFVGIILPDGAYKKYIDLVLGLILIFVVMQPLLGVESFEDAAADFFAMVPNAQVQQNRHHGTADTLPLLDQSFQAILQNQVAALLRPQGYRVARLNADFDRDTGAIASLDLVLQEIAQTGSNDGQTQRTDQGQNRLITIDPVTIRIPRLGESLGQEKLDETADTTTLKILVSDFYNLPKDHIHISIGQ